MPNDAVAGRRTETLRQMLLERRQEVLKEVEDLLARRRSSQGTLREESVPDTGDMALQDASGDQQIALIESRNRVRQQLDDALRKLDEGTYGRCEDCGQPISESRLKVLPFAQRCVACQEKFEMIEQIEKAQEREEI